MSDTQELSDKLHAAIMNLPTKPGFSMVNATKAQILAYKLGHRDARHAAAELALEHLSTRPAVTLSDEEIQDAVFTVLRRWKDDRAWDRYTRESGPYDVTSLRPEVLEIIRAVLARASVPTEAQTLHPRTADLVDRFAAALKEKLAAAEKKYGYSDGWADPGWMDECRAKLIEHVHKGDPRDVAAYCAFLWHHGARCELEDQFIYDATGKWPTKPSASPPLPAPQSAEGVKGPEHG